MMLASQVRKELLAFSLLVRRDIDVAGKRITLLWSGGAQPYNFWIADFVLAQTPPKWLRASPHNIDLYLAYILA